jgi:hypothetical protein
MAAPAVAYPEATWALHAFAPERIVDHGRRRDDG